MWPVFGSVKITHNTSDRTFVSHGINSRPFSNISRLLNPASRNQLRKLVSHFSLENKENTLFMTVLMETDQAIANQNTQKTTLLVNNYHHYSLTGFKVFN